MKKTKLLFGILLFFILTFIACKKDILETLPKNNIKKEQQAILGKKLKNPYSVKNMQIAYNNLLKANRNKSTTVEIKATHYYVKFKPANEEDLNKLKQDSTLDLYSYPLDYEMLEGQDVYHDPEIEDNQPTYQYCAVRVGYNFPDVQYEILEDLYIPEEESRLKSKKAFINALVDEALRITGNLESDIKKSTKQKSADSDRSFLPSKWRPAGRIMVWDDNIGSSTDYKQSFSHWVYYDCNGQFRNHSIADERKDDICKKAVYKYEKITIKGSYVPVQGVIVRARRWFITHKDDTDAKGYYSCDGTFRYDAKYSIVWERYEFEIRKSGLHRAKYKGPKQRSNWNLKIRGGKQEFYATIFRAAFHYTYGNIKGLRRPPKNGIWKVQLKLRAFYSSNNFNGEHAPVRGWLGIGSAIHIFNPQHKTAKIYGTVIHEIAHASHWNMSPVGYAGCENKVAESWARGVQWELTRMVYPQFVIKENYPIYFGNYKGVVEDIIDGKGTIGSPDEYDQVTGYTIRQIEDALIGVWKWNKWKNEIKKLYKNETEKNLDKLFDHWY